MIFLFAVIIQFVECMHRVGRIIEPFKQPFFTFYVERNFDTVPKWLLKRATFKSWVVNSNFFNFSHVREARKSVRNKDKNMSGCSLRSQEHFCNLGNENALLDCSCWRQSLASKIIRFGTCWLRNTT